MNAPSPQLQDFLDALQSWDHQLRQLRNLNAQTVPVTVSVRKQVLGYNTVDDTYNRLLFRNFIAKHRIAGNNPAKQDVQFDFPIQIADQTFFPALPNLKLDSLQVQLTSIPGRSLRGPGDVGNPALVDLILVGEARIRTWLAQWPTNDAPDGKLIDVCTATFCVVFHR